MTAVDSLRSPGSPVYDAGFKKLFSHRLMIELLIRRHVPEWAGRIDFATLETVPTELIGDKLAQRYADLAWRGVARDEAGDFLLLIEFQGRPEPLMALRVAAYAALAAKDFLDWRAAQGKPRRWLVVEPLVLHHGNRRWNAPTRVGDVLGGSGVGGYRLVSRRPPDAREPGRLDLPRMALGLGGGSTVEDVRAELPRIREVVERCGDDAFDLHMARTVAAMLRSRGIPKRRMEEAETMETVVSAFERGLNDLVRKGREQGIRKGWEQGRKQGIRQGREQGRKQGIRQGREQGQTRMLRRLVAHRFGSAVEGELAGVLAVPVGPERMRLLAEAVLECDSGADFMARAREVVADG